MRKYVSFNNLPAETLYRIAQLLSSSSMKYLPVQSEDSEDAFPSVPNLLEGFVTSVVSLSRVNKRLRAICKPLIHTYVCCGDIGRLTRLIGDYWYKSEGKAPDLLVRTLSAILPSYSVNVNNIWHTMGKGFYDEDLGLVVALIPKTFPSLRCLRLHNVPDLDPFFKICASLVSLRILDISFCDTVLDADVDFEDRVDEFTTSCEQIVRNTPPLEVLRIAVLFGTGPKSFFVSNRAKAIMQIISLIRASSSTLFEFSIAGNGHVYFDALKLTQMHFPRLRRLTLWSMLGNVADIRKFILVHQANLAELNLTFFCTRSYPTLSCLSRIMKGICPLEGNKAAFAEEEEKIDSLVHPEDARWGHFECDVFAYAMREGKVVELSISFPQIDIDGFEVNSNGDLRIFKLAILLGQFTHLEILTLMACRHDERDFVSLMGSLGNLCRRHLCKLRTLNLFVELEGVCWGAGSFREENINLPMDESDYDDEFYSDDEMDKEDGDGDGAAVPTNIATPFEKRAERWKKMEDKYYLLVESIMTTFFEKASSAREVFWHFGEPREGARSSCWVWRQVHQKGVATGSKTTTSRAVKRSLPSNPLYVKKSKAVKRPRRSNTLNVKKPKSKGFVVGDMMIQGTFRDPARFTYAVGREAEYKMAFSHEKDWLFAPRLKVCG